MSVEVVAYAKLNLALRVVGLRDDGYHAIVSEVQTIDLADRLTIELSPNGVDVEGNYEIDGTDLVEVAAREVLQRKRCGGGARIRVKKEIPMGAGLGGGSSDAAAVLAALDRLTPPALPSDGLHDAASQLGSDVPLFLQGGRIRISGRGEHVERLEPSPPGQFVVLVPPVRCSTGLIYARWDELAGARAEPLSSDLQRGENALLESALDVHPKLVPYHEAMRSLDAVYHGMSGSGSSFFAAYHDPAAAARAQAALKRRFEDSDVFACRSTNAGHRIAEVT
jgi:4-diphosphocytidyl-2-C-methyl-D-erythritol kinase